MFSILILDTDEILSQAEINILNKHGHAAFVCTTWAEAKSALDKQPIDLIIIDTNVEGIKGRGFEYLEKLRIEYPHLPYIMTTEENVDNMISLLIKYRMGNVLLKPVPADEFINLAEKLITKKGIFGLHNYIHDIQDMKRIKILRSDQIRPAIDKVIQFMQEWDFKSIDAMTLRLLLQETLTNAVYHSHDHTQEKLERTHIVLEDGKFVELVFGHSENQFAVGITDFNGKLSQAAILDSIFKITEQERKLRESIENGGEFVEISDHGRGIDLLRKLAGQYYFNIKKGEATEVLIMFDERHIKDHELSSLKIIEIM